MGGGPRSLPPGHTVGAPDPDTSTAQTGAGVTMAASIDEQITAWCYLESGDGLVCQSANQVLEALEAGRLDLDTPLRRTPDRAPTPLRDHLRDLVFVAHQDLRRTEGAQARPSSPLEIAFQGAALGFAVSDLGGRILEVNPALCALLGVDAQDLVGRLVGDVSIADDHAQERDLANELFAGRRAFYELDKRFLHGDGRRIPCRVHIALVRDEHDLPRFAVATITDRRRHLELEMLRALSVQADAIRATAQRLGHDFSNTLMVIRLEAELGQEAITGGQDALSNLQAISEAAEMSARFVESLRTLSASQGPDPSRLELRGALLSCLAFFRGLVGGDRSFELDIPPGPVEVSIARSTLDRVLLNLVSNAAHHTPPGGHVRVAVEPQPRWIRLRVEDDGSGMPEAIRARALEPFFTARPGGTGLGLAIAKALVEAAGGSLSITSELGSGTAVELSLPRVAGP